MAKKKLITLALLSVVVPAFSATPGLPTTNTSKRPGLKWPLFGKRESPGVALLPQPSTSTSGKEVEEGQSNPGFLVQPRPWKEVMQEAANELDRLRGLEKRWGSISFAPLVFAPRSYTDASNTHKGSFAIEEDTGTNDITLGTLYNDFDSAEGEASFTQKVLTRNFAAGGTQVLPVEAMQFKEQLEDFNRNRGIFRAVQDAQVQGFQDSVQRGTDAALLADAARREQLDTARANLASAQTAADNAAREAADRKLEAENAQTLLDAEKLKQTILETAVPRDEVAVSQAKIDVAKATAAQATAKAASDLAVTRNTAAKEALEARKTAVTNAENALNTQLGSPLFDFTKNPVTLVSPAAGSLAAPGLSGQAATSTLPLTEAGTLLGALKSDPANLAIGTTPAFSLRPTSAGGSFNPLARITAAAGAALAKEVFTFLGDPVAAEAFKEKKLIFGVTSITVNPGYETRKDFTANVEVTPYLHYSEPQEETVRLLLMCSDYPLNVRARIAAQYPAALTKEQRVFFDNLADIGDDEDCESIIDGLENYDTKDKFGRPYVEGARKDGIPDTSVDFIVNAVSPLVDVQNLDLASSYARQDEVALFLSATLAQAGLRGQASTFNQWVRQRRKDVATRSTVAVATSYSLAGGVFGFEIGSRLRALAEPSARKSDAAMILDRQAFPVLVLFGLNEDQTKPLLTWGDQKKGAKGIKVWQLRSDFVYRTNWTRNSHNLLSHFKASRKPSDVLDDMIATRALKRNYDYYLNQSLHLFRVGKDEGEYAEFRDLSRQLLGDFESFTRKLFGARFTISLPADWLVSPRRDTALTKESRNLTVEPSKVVFIPSELSLVNDSTEASPSARTQVVVTGPNLREVDWTQIAVTSGNAEVIGAVSPLTAGTPDVVTMNLRVNGEAGKVQLTLPIKADSAALAAMASNTISVSLPYKINVSHEPQIRALEASEFDVVGQKTGDVWSGKLRLFMEGKNLDRLEAADAVVHINGKTVPGSTFTAVGKEAAMASIQLSGPEQGEAFVEFKVKPGNSLDKTFTPKFKFKIVAKP